MPTLKFKSEIDSNVHSGAPEFHTVIHVWLERPWVAAQVNTAIAAEHIDLRVANLFKIPVKLGTIHLKCRHFSGGGQEFAEYANVLNG